ncbi:MAG: TPM domain-containing protein [Gemmatimonadales bacterium]
MAEPDDRHPRWARRLFTEADFAAIAGAVAQVEATTSAELRVHLERRVHRWPGQRADALRRARKVFTHLGMHLTAERHGVLIYLALEDHKLAVVGDEGIHRRVGDQYWEVVRDLMIARLREGRALDAVLFGVAEVGRVLAEHFPRRPDDRNELSDQVSLR